MGNHSFDRHGFAEQFHAYCGQLVKILITLEPYGIFGSNFAYVFISSPEPKALGELIV